jgi:hypothetical protein
MSESELESLQVLGGRTGSLAIELAHLGQDLGEPMRERVDRLRMIASELADDLTEIYLALVRQVTLSPAMVPAPARHSEWMRVGEVRRTLSW